MATESGNTDATQQELQQILDEIQILEEELPEVWTLNDSITELERTIAAYNRIEP